MAPSIDTAGIPPSFEPCTLGLEHLTSLVDLPLEDLIATLGRDGDLNGRSLGRADE